MDEREFDKFADEYHRLHASNIAASGEPPEYFHEKKIADLAAAWAGRAPPRQILDFGSGVGNSVPFFRKYFPAAALTCADVSARSLELSRSRWAGAETYAPIVGGALPFPDAAFDIVFSACVFHHIDHAEHGHWLAELNRVTRPGGELFIYEHNPFNPLTVSAVRTCPFDENAHLITGAAFARRAAGARWADVRVRYRVFFPRALAALRPFEPWLGLLPLGAQYSVSGRKAAAAAVS
jgi:SAM-dependent methyltransferase